MRTAHLLNATLTTRAWSLTVLFWEDFQLFFVILKLKALLGEP